jgi:predicted amidophosphoribosyltransferase
MNDNINEEYHCTGCGEKVRFEDKICPKCGADLSVVIDEDEDINIVAVKTYMNEFEALLAKEKLNTYDIDSFVSGDNVGGTRPQLTLSRGVRLMVNEKGLEKAVNILDEEELNENYYETKCSHCGADVTLNKSEYDSGEFICPGCKKKNKI